jgi:hypothetical protein
VGALELQDCEVVVMVHAVGRALRVATHQNVVIPKVAELHFHYRPPDYYLE